MITIHKKKLYIIIILVFSLQIKFLNASIAESSYALNYLPLYRTRLGLESIGKSEGGKKFANLTRLKWLGTGALWYGISNFISKIDDFGVAHSFWPKEKPGTVRILKFLFKHIFILAFMIAFHKELTTNPLNFFDSTASIGESLKDTHNRTIENIQKIIINFNNDQETNEEDAKITEQTLENLSPLHQKIIKEKIKTHIEELEKDTKNQPTKFQKAVLNWAKKTNKFEQ